MVAVSLVLLVLVLAVLLRLAAASVGVVAVHGEPVDNGAAQEVIISQGEMDAQCRCEK